MPTRWAILSLALGSFLLSACQTGLGDQPVAGVSERQQAAQAIASAGGLTGQVLATDAFAVQAYARGSAGAITIYLEGDGAAWRTPTRPSTDPTPRNPVALRLAGTDTSEAVAYIARPCQFVRDARCARRFWTTHRFSEPILAAVNEAISALKSQAGATIVHLVGYSGGGAVAALLAAQRDDVASLRTVAGYLDHVALNEAREVDPLSGSLDPMVIAARLTALPQLHFAGMDDEVIPSWVVANFVAAQGPEACAQTVLVGGASHGSGWVPLWPDLLQTPLPCADGAR